jgi:hypothetical protein
MMQNNSQTAGENYNHGRHDLPWNSPFFTLLLGRLFDFGRPLFWGLFPWRLLFDFACRRFLFARNGSPRWRGCWRMAAVGGRVGSPCSGLGSEVRNVREAGVKCRRRPEGIPGWVGLTCGRIAGRRRSEGVRISDSSAKATEVGPKVEVIQRHGSRCHGGRSGGSSHLRMGCGLWSLVSNRR